MRLFYGFWGDCFPYSAAHLHRCSPSVSHVHGTAMRAYEGVEEREVVVGDDGVEVVIEDSGVERV